MILRSFDELISEAKRDDIKKSEDPFLAELDNLFANATQNKSLDSIYESEANIVDPLKQLCKKANSRKQKKYSCVQQRNDY